MRSALLHKSVTDLTRRKARTAFAVLALAIAVASVGIFALPPLADRAMQREIAASRLADLTVDTAAAPSSRRPRSAALARLPNVDGVRGAQLLLDPRLGGRPPREGVRDRRPGLRAPDASTSSTSRRARPRRRRRALRRAERPPGPPHGRHRRRRSGSSTTNGGTCTAPGHGRGPEHVAAARW